MLCFATFAAFWKFGLPPTNGLKHAAACRSMPRHSKFWGTVGACSDKLPMFFPLPSQLIHVLAHVLNPHLDLPYDLGWGVSHLQPPPHTAKKPIFCRKHTEKQQLHTGLSTNWMLQSPSHPNKPLPSANCCPVLCKSIVLQDYTATQLHAPLASNNDNHSRILCISCFQNSSHFQPSHGRSPPYGKHWGPVVLSPDHPETMAQAGTLWHGLLTMHLTGRLAVLSVPVVLTRVCKQTGMRGWVWCLLTNHVRWFRRRARAFLVSGPHT